MLQAGASKAGSVAGPSNWTADALRTHPATPNEILPVIETDRLEAIGDDLDLWDMWQMQERDGSTSIIDGRSWWFFLATPKFSDPEARHDHARIRLLTHAVDGWMDHGYLLPDGFGPGSREWSGSTVRDADGVTVTLYYTASGRAEGGPRFEQRLFETSGTLDISGRRISEWSTPMEIVAADGDLYAVANEDVATNGMILGFRDPSYFRDPADGAEYMLFSGNAGGSTEIFDGVIGVARRSGGGWEILPPLIDAGGVNKELERAHIVYNEGNYYLFWSTHGVRFAPGIPGRSGLYGMMARSMGGPWRPLNGSGLVAGNPVSEPQQAYCWLVTNELDVLSFANYPKLMGRNPSESVEVARATFAGTVAPVFHLSISEDTTSIAMGWSPVL